jgi:hypothetical protein
MTVGVSPVRERTAARGPAVGFVDHLAHDLDLSLSSDVFPAMTAAKYVCEPAVRPYKSLVSGCREEVGENDD